MTQQETINRDLETFARSAALSLNVPFVTIALNAARDNARRNRSTATSKAVFVEGAWATDHAEIDLAALDNASAVAQQIPFFACVPIRSDAGETLGTLCCGDSDKRDLSNDEVGVLKAVAAQVAAHVGVASAAPAFASI
jgi:GAF domain-containing protein